MMLTKDSTSQQDWFETAKRYIAARPAPTPAQAAIDQARKVALRSMLKDGSKLLQNTDLVAVIEAADLAANAAMESVLLKCDTTDPFVAQLLDAVRS